jgi:hypothetical protein
MTLQLICSEHGLRPGDDIRRGRCTACTPLYANAGRPRPRILEPQDYPQLAERIRAGETLEAVGRDYGVTRERVRQVVVALDPDGGRDGQRLRRALRVEQETVTAEVRSVQAALRNGPCRTCTGPVTRATRSKRPGKVTCSPRCAALWSACRMHLDEDEHRRHALAQARWVLANSADPTRRRSAERTLNGQRVQDHGRWTIAGSRVERMLTEVRELRLAVRATGESWWT